MQMILNELSAETCLYTIEEGKQMMEKFLHTYRSMKDIIHNDQLFLNNRYMEISLAKNYNILQWKNDKSIDIELKRLFNVMLNRSDVYESVYESHDKIDIQSEELTCENKRSLGCLIAYKTNNCVISFLSHNYWENYKLRGKYYYLNDEEQNLHEKEVEIVNVSGYHNIELFKNEFEELCKNEIRYGFNSGKALLAKKEELFPNLIFCKNSIKQLSKENDRINISQIFRRLMELQNCFYNEKGLFDKDKLLNVTPESEATLDAYRDEHTFESPSGEKLLFSLHIRFTGKYEGRIFFYPETELKQCYIGHIGNKLKNVTYK